MSYWAVVGLRPLVELALVLAEHPKFIRIFEDKVTLEFGGKEEELKLWNLDDVEYEVRKKNGKVVIKDFDDSLHIQMYILKYSLEKMNITNIVWEKEPKYEVVKSGTKCVGYDYPRTQKYLEVENAERILTINFPSYYRWYPFRDENNYVILDSGEIFYAGVMEGIEHHCHRSDIDELTERIAELVLKPRTYTTRRGDYDAKVFQFAEVYYYNEKHKLLYETLRAVFRRIEPKFRYY